jgi:hypothetical protein
MRVSDHKALSGSGRLGAAVLVTWYPFSAQAEDVQVMLSGGQRCRP